MAPIDPQNPTVTTPLQITRQYVEVKKTSLENAFYKNVGFWGTILILIGIFLPWFTDNLRNYNLVDILNYDFTRDSSSSNSLNDNSDALIFVFILKIIFSIIIISAVSLLIDSFANFFSKSLAYIIRLLPFIFIVIMIFFIIFFYQGFPNYSSSMVLLFKILGVGSYSTIFGSILLLFCKKY